MKFKKLLINNSDFGQRFDFVVSKYFVDISRNKIQNLIKDGCFLINDKKVKTGYILGVNDEITYNIPEIKEDNFEPENLNLDIIYEDDDLLVLNKPKNLVVHPAKSHKGITLINGLKHQVDKLSSINGSQRPGIIHRLDKDTSGLMVVAKSDEAHKALTVDISRHDVVRNYYAIVYGTFENKSGTINMPIKRDLNNKTKMSVNKDGKHAVTHFNVLKEFNNFSFLEVKLETGRTHQIRVHMAKINHPILGDKTYGPKKAYGDEGQFLHAYKISFFHPIKKEMVSFESEIPEYFLNAFKDLS